MIRQVKVSKATFDLRKGETVEMFIRQINSEIRDKFEVGGTRANDFEDAVYLWCKAILPGRVIFERSGNGARKQGVAGMFAVDFTRDPNTQKFSFSEPVGVMEEKEFVPIQKSNDFDVHYLESDWHGLGLAPQRAK